MRKILFLSLALILILGITSHGTSGFFSDLERGSTTVCTALEWEPCDGCDPPCCGEHCFSFISRVDSTWTYRVTSGTSPALSHWVLEWLCCDAVEAVYEFNENGELIEGTEWECQCFTQHTQMCGIKIENNLHEYVDGETRIVEIVLDKYYPGDCIRVGTKADNNIDYCKVWGPVCSDCLGHSDPVVSVTFPDHYVSYSFGHMVPISWCVTDEDCDPLTIDIDFSPDDGANYDYHIATVTIHEDGSCSCDMCDCYEGNCIGDCGNCYQVDECLYVYEWIIPWNYYLISNYCRIKVTATDPCGSDFDVSARFCPHLPPPPEVTVISPNGGESWQAGETYPITWTAEGDFPEMMQIDAYLSLNDGNSWIKILSDEENDGVCEWEVPPAIPASDEARIKVVAKYPLDLIGQDDSDEVFSLLELGSPPSEPSLDEAYNLVVAMSQATLTEEGEIACDIALNNSHGENDITIDKLVIHWDVDIEDANSDEGRIIEIWSADELEYITILTSGAEWDIEDFVIAPGEEHSLSFIFSDGKPGETISIEFIMSDGSIIMVYLKQCDEE